MRGVADPDVAGLVHGMELHDGGRWFAGVAAVDGELGQIEAVIGEGIARQLASADVGKSAQWKETHSNWLAAPGASQACSAPRGPLSTLKSGPTPCTSAICSTRTSGLLWFTGSFRRTQKALASLRITSGHATKDKVHAQPETEYYAELSQTNRQMLFAILFVASVAAVGGVFGLMNTMFAAIANRAADLAVLRVLGFRRWQIALSLLLESVGLAFVGGVLGCGVALLARRPSSDEFGQQWGSEREDGDAEPGGRADGGDFGTPVRANYGSSGWTDTGLVVPAPVRVQVVKVRVKGWVSLASTYLSRTWTLAMGNLRFLAPGAA